jgi:hypothetical protein
MKKITNIVGAAMLCLAAFAFTGCGTVSPTDQTIIDSTAAVLRGAARDGAVVAMTPPTGNTNNAEYFRLAASAIGTFVTSKDTSPAAFQAALTSLNVPQLNDPYVKIGIGTVVDLYQLYYGIYVKGNVVSNAPVALELLTSVQDGFNQALGNPVTSLMLRRSSVGMVGDVLPRPITAFKPAKR